MTAGADLTPERLNEFIEVADPDWIQKQTTKYSSFREGYSPVGQWSHRPPSMSPLIPIIFWASKEPYQLTYEGPMGYWFGEPKSILGRFIAQLSDFRNYWRNLPNDSGIRNMRWAFRTPSRFAGFEHELRTASTYRNRTPYDVEPRFFDPNSGLGEPDIILRKNDQTFNIQCKALDPSVSSVMSFELFNYLTGCLCRINQDYNIHGFLTLSIQEGREYPITRHEIDGIINQIHQSVDSKLKIARSIPFIGGTANFSARSIKESILPNRLDSFSIWSDGNLFKRRLTIPSIKSNYGKLVTVCQVSGGRIPSFESYIYPMLEDSAKKAPKSDPLIITIHLYPHVPIHEYSHNPRIQNTVISHLNDFFDRHRHVCLVLISSYAQRLFWLGGNLQTLATPAWEIESPYWKVERPNYDPGVM